MRTTKCFDESLNYEVDIAQDELRRKVEKPDLSPQMALKIAEEHFAIRSAADFPGKSVKELDSYDDRNFLLHGRRAGKEAVEKFVLKVHNGVESDRSVHIAAQNAAFLHLRSRGISCPSPLPTASKQSYAVMVELPFKGEAQGTKKFAARLLEFLPGRPFNTVTVGHKNVRQVGSFLGRLSNAFADFEHQGTKRRHQWDLRNTLLTKVYVKYCKDTVRPVVSQVLQAFEEEVFPVQDKLRMGVLHGDFNDANILMAEDGSRVAGVLDLGDMVYSSVVNDVAIAMAYAMLRPTEANEPLSGSLDLLIGYAQVATIEPQECELLRVLVASRLATSICLGAYSMSKDPTNEYLALHAKPAIDALMHFWSVDKAEVSRMFKDAVREGQATKAES